MNIDLIKRPSARGIKKCKDCGLFNGQKALSCKNDKCKSYKSRSRTKNSRNSSLKAVKLHSNGESTYYSVRIKERGPNFRSFVKITDKFLAENVISRSAVCFVESCKSLEGVVNCVHVQNISDDVEAAVQLNISKHVLEMFNISSETKSRIWDKMLNAAETPFCQRASKSMFVVDVGGLEHVQIDDNRFSCSCKKHRPCEICDHVLIAFSAILSNESVKTEFSVILKSKVCEEFFQKPNENQINGFEVQDEAIIFQAGDDFLMNDNLFEQPEVRTEVGVNDIYEDFELMDCQIELMDQFNLTDRIDLCPSDIEITDDSHLLNNENLIFSAIESYEGNTQNEILELELGDNLGELITTKESALKAVSKNCDEKLKQGSYNVRKLLKTLESNGIVLTKLKPSGRGPSLEAEVCQLSFNQWLESVIEKTNSTIDYNNRECTPKLLSFDVHHNFFNCLNARFSVGHTRRQPKETVPLDRGLTKYVYKFTHYKSLANVFKTDKIQLAFVKSFTQNSNGHFEELLENFNIFQVKNTDKKGKVQRITPKIYKTFIKFGKYKSEPEKIHEFVIEWTPNVHKISQFGEMCLKFEFGRKHFNDQGEVPMDDDQIQPSIITITESL